MRCIADGALEAGLQQEDESQKGVRRSMLMIGALAGACLVGAAALTATGGGSRVALAGGFTSHLDMDKGTLSGLEAAANAFPSRASVGGFTDAAPHVPRILAAQWARDNRASTVGNSQMLSSAFDKKSKHQLAVEGMQTSDYADMTDAAGME